MVEHDQEGLLGYIGVTIQEGREQGVDRIGVLGEGRESLGGTGGLEVSPDLNDDLVGDLHLGGMEQEIGVCL